MINNRDFLLGIQINFISDLKIGGAHNEHRTPPMRGVPSPGGPAAAHVNARYQQDLRDL